MSDEDTMCAADDGALICNIIVLRSLRQRLALLALSTPGKKGDLEFSFHLLESIALICALETDYLYRNPLLSSLKSIHDSMKSIDESNDERIATFIKLPVGQQLTFLDQILPLPKDPAEILAGDRPNKDIDLLLVTPQSTLTGKFFGYDEPDSILQDYHLTANYAEEAEAPRPSPLAGLLIVIRIYWLSRKFFSNA